MRHDLRIGLLKGAGALLLAGAIGFAWLAASGAAEPPTPGNTSAPSLELAIFPWRMVGLGSDIHDAVWKGFREAMQKAGLFAPKYSYYPTRSGRETRMISRELLNKSIERDLWIRKNKREWYRPDVELISSIAHKLDVDAVLMYSLDRTRHWITMQVFLVDVEKGRVFDASVTDSPARAELLRAPIEGITLKVFREYQSNRL